MKTICKNCKFVDWNNLVCRHKSEGYTDYVTGEFVTKTMCVDKNTEGECIDYEGANPFSLEIEIDMNKLTKKLDKKFEEFKCDIRGEYITLDTKFLEGMYSRDLLASQQQQEDSLGGLGQAFAASNLDRQRAINNMYSGLFGSII